MPSFLKKNAARPKHAFIIGICAFALGLLAIQLAPRFMAYPETGDGLHLARKASDPNIKLPDAVVVELFTSQACSSCPSAEAVLRALSARPDIMTFEYHVDYWDGHDDLFNGRWKDAFSDGRWTQRQAAYLRAMGSKRGAYTPQAVVDGKYDVVGSYGRDLGKTIQQAARARKDRPRDHMTLSGEKLVVKGPQGKADVLKVTFIKRAVTNVLSGENKGKSLASYNIVTGLEKIAEYTGPREEFRIDQTTAPGQGCAFLLQDAKSMQILMARFCGL